MNPQFPNMMGMGRGMPNGNMQQMNVNNPSAQLQRYILQTLQGEGPWTGWQADVPIQERVIQIKLLVDSLRLLGPPVELNRAVEVALNFERKEFAQQPTKEDYQRECGDKLSKIRDQRAQQLRQQQLGNGQNVGMMNSNFPQQMQMRQAMGMQAQMPPGMQPSPMPTPNQSMAQLQNMNQVQSMGQMNQLNQAAVGNMPQMPTQATELTREDNVVINQRAAELAKGTPKDEMRNIVQRMDPRLRNNLAQKGIDPIIYHFRMLATKEFRNRQLQTGNAAQSQMANPNNNMNMMGQMVNGQQNSVNAALMRNGAQPTTAPFLPNYADQQQAGWKSQQEGQPVVPASNNQNMTPEQIRIQQQMLANQHSNQATPQMNQNFLAQQQMMKAQMNQQQGLAQQQQQQQLQQAQHQRQLQAARAQVQAQAQAHNQIRAQAAAAAQNNLQNVGPQAGAMNMLNRPVEAGMPNGSPQPSRPQSRAPMPGQQQQMPSEALVNQLQQQLMQNPASIMQRLPPALQNFLRSKPPNEWAMTIARWQQGSMKRSVSQQPGQPTSQQPGQQMPNAQMLGPGPTPMQVSRSAGQPGQQGNMQTPETRNAMPNMQQQTPNPAMTSNPESMRQRQLQIQQQQQRMANGQLQAHQPTPGQNNADLSKRPLTQQELTMMDSQVIHPQVFRALQPFLVTQNTFVPDFKNWLQLKQWLVQNPQQKLSMPIVINMQTNQFHFQLRMKQQANAAAQMSGGPMPQQGQQLQQQTPQQQQQLQLPVSQPPPQQQQVTPQQPQQQTVPSLTQQPQNGPPTMSGTIRPITDQDIQKIRQSNPKVANMTDDQIRNSMINRLKMQAALAQQQKNQGQQTFMQAQGQNQAQNQNGPQVQNQQPQAVPQSIPAHNQPTQQPNQNLNRPQPPKQQAQPQQQQPQQIQQPTASQQKNLKRPNQDESTDVPGPNQSATRQPGVEAGKPSIPQITKDQFEKLSENDKQRYMNLMRARHQRQVLQNRISEMSKQVQSQSPQLRPITNMDPASRKRIIAFLTSPATKNMLDRFEPFLMAYCHIENNDPTIKTLLNNRNLLIAQYKPQTVADKTWEPADNFSITAENVESIINNMSAKFQQTMAKQTQRQQQSQHQPNQQAPSQQPAQQQVQPQQAQQQLPLTAENLNLAQAQALQQSKKGGKSKDVPPSAPIATQPPFQIGDNRGHGAPRYAPSQALKQEDLKLDPKRRKKNPGTTPTPTNAAASPDIAQEQRPLPRPFKCSYSGCEYQSTGFQFREELDQHVRMAHKSELELVTDPLALLDNSLMQAFDLDDQLHYKKKLEPAIPTAPTMQKTMSKTGSNLKLESKPSTPIPMARVASQQLGRNNMPTTPNVLKTPQSVKAEIKTSTPQAIEVKEEPDLWATSNFGLDTLRDTFGDMEWNDVMPTMDPEQVDLDDCIRTYMQSDEWQKVMNGGVLPNSSDGSTDKSKSPGEGSEQSAPGGEAQKHNEAAKQSNDIDLSIDGINIDQDGFEDLIMTESQLQEMEEGSWEKIERPSPENRQDMNMIDPFASLEDPDLDAWSKPLYEPLQANGFPDSNSPFEPIDLDEFVSMNGPEVWAAGSMEWNAVGEPGQQIRKELGWPIEGAQGFKK